MRCHGSALRTVNWKLITQRFKPATAGGTAQFVLPGVVIEIEPNFVVGARLEGSRRSARRLRRLGVRPLESPVVMPHPSKPNLTDGDDLRRAVQEVAELVGNGNGRLGLIVPDRVVRAGVLSFETLPGDTAEAESIIRWRLRGNLPFPPEEARVSFQVVGRERGHVEVLAIAARVSVLAEYEAMLEPVNGRPVLTLPATAALLPLLPDEGEPQILVHACAGWVTTVVVAAGRVCSWRTRDLARAPQADWPGEVAFETARVMASCQDQLSVRIRRAWACARPPAPRELARALEGATSCEVGLLTPSAELAGNLTPEERSLFEHFGAPVAGLAANVG